METKEELLLDILDQNSELSQREISEKMGLSVGIVNSLIRSCTKKGLVKVEKLNYRSMRYILTPQGIAEKTKKTVKYIHRAYNQINKMRNYLFDLRESVYLEEFSLILFGEKNEYYEMIKGILKEFGIKYDYQEEIETFEIEKTYLNLNYEINENTSVRNIQDIIN